MDKNTSRFESFSDGIFGVAITLLALDIRMPELRDPSNESFLIAIFNKWPEYITFFNSFATTLLIWIGHHKMIQRLRTLNQPIILANSLVLLLVVLLPYPTRNVGIFIYTSANQAAVSFFIGYISFTVLSMMLLNVTMRKYAQLLCDSKADSVWLESLMKSQAIGFCLYVMACVVAFYSPLYAMYFTFLIWAFWIYNMRQD